MTVQPSSSINELSAECPYGSQVIAGGYVIENNAGDMVVDSSQMNSDTNSWVISATNKGGASRDISAFAVCLAPEES
jgi:hypothetical protein